MREEIYISLLNKISFAEKQFNIGDEDLNLWHNALKKYFSRQPDIASVKEFMKNVRSEKDIIDEIEENINIISSNPQIKKIIQDLYMNFDNLIG